MNFTIYKTQTGEIIQSGFCLDEDYNNQIIPQDCDILPLASDAINNYIDNNEIKDKPIQPNEFYFFNYLTKNWELDLESLSLSVITKRNNLLFQSDWTQLPDINFSNELKQQWVIYRQSLRDITKQESFPNVVWPIPPNTN
jgi:hypothetical protein